MLPNLDTREVQVEPQRPLLKLSLTPPRRVSAAGATVPYRLTVSSHRRDALNVTVCDRPGVGLHVVAAPGAAQKRPGKACWQLKKLPVDRARAFTLRVRIQPGFPGGRLFDQAFAHATTARADPQRAVIIVPGHPSCRIVESNPVATASC